MRMQILGGSTHSPTNVFTFSWDISRICTKVHNFTLLHCKTELDLRFEQSGTSTSWSAYNFQLHVVRSAQQQRGSVEVFHRDRCLSVGCDVQILGCGRLLDSEARFAPAESSCHGTIRLETELKFGMLKRRQSGSRIGTPCEHKQQRIGRTCGVRINSCKSFPAGANCHHAD